MAMLQALTRVFRRALRPVAFNAGHRTLVINSAPSSILGMFAAPISDGVWLGSATHPVRSRRVALMGLPCRPTLPRRSRRQGLRARGASACGLRPSANPDSCAAPWCSGLGQSRPIQTGVRHVAVFHFFRCRCAAGARCRWAVPSCACRGGAVAGAARAVAARAARCHDVVAAGGEGLPATGDRCARARGVLCAVPGCAASGSSS